MATPLTTSATNLLTTTGEFDPTQPTTTLRLASGQTVVLPTALFLAQPESGYLPASDETIAFPIVEEQLQVGKRTVETAKVRLEKRVDEYHETLDVPLAVRTYDIERVVLNRPVEVAPAVRQEGDTTIYPLVEEQLVMTTQLILKEELRVTKRDTERRDTRTVTLKRENIEVTRTPLT